MYRTFAAFRQEINFQPVHLSLAVLFFLTMRDAIGICILHHRIRNVWVYAATGPLRLVSNQGQEVSCHAVPIDV